MKALDFACVAIITGVAAGAITGILLLTLAYMHVLPGMYAGMGIALIVGAIMLALPAIELEDRSAKNAMRNYMANHRGIGA